jgi:hypothetical protein
MLKDATDANGERLMSKSAFRRRWKLSNGQVNALITDGRLRTVTIGKRKFLPEEEFPRFVSSLPDTPPASALGTVGSVSLQP